MQQSTSTLRMEDRLSNADDKFNPVRTNGSVAPRRHRPGNAKADEMARVLLKPWPRVEGVWAACMGMVLCILCFLNNID